MLPGSFLPDQEKLNLHSKHTFISSSPQETMDIGKKIAKNLDKCDIIAIKGVLGAGKTCLVKGIGDFFEINDITSPTYTIVSEHEAKIRGESLAFFHIDAYRLNGDDDFNSMGGEEYLYSNGIAVVEWSERISKAIPSSAINIEIEIKGENSRTIHINRDKTD